MIWRTTDLNLIEISMTRWQNVRNRMQERYEALGWCLVLRQIWSIIEMMLIKKRVEEKTSFRWKPFCIVETSDVLYFWSTGLAVNYKWWLSGRAEDSSCQVSLQDTEGERRYASRGNQHYESFFVNTFQKYQVTEIQVSTQTQSTRHIHF